MNFIDKKKEKGIAVEKEKKRQKGFAADVESSWILLRTYQYFSFINISVVADYVPELS